MKIAGEDKAEAGAVDGDWIEVGDDHAIFVRDVGAREKPAAVFLHGGPGSGCTPEHLGFFDLSRFRVVLPDQRGAGRSRAVDRFAANTTQHLIADLEVIRERLGIARWLVVGGSWGATLALAYAEAHPERVTGLVLRAVFLGTRAELDWAFIEAPRRFRPELFAEFLAFLEAGERTDPLPAFWRRLTHPSVAIRTPAAIFWNRYERALSRLLPPPGPASAPANVPSTPSMEAHYFAANCFLAENALLANASRLADIPGIIVQGRYDLLCPPATSFALATAWPNAELRFVEDAGHTASEAPMGAALTKAIADISAG